MKEEIQSTSKGLRPINWDEQLCKYAFYEKFKIKDAYVAWDNSITVEGRTTVNVVGDTGEEFFHSTWTYKDKVVIRSEMTVFTDKQKLKTWLKSIRDTNFDNLDNLLNVVRFLYF